MGRDQAGKLATHFKTVMNPRLREWPGLLSPAVMNRFRLAPGLGAVIQEQGACSRLVLALALPSKRIIIGGCPQIIVSTGIVVFGGLALLALLRCLLSPCDRRVALLLMDLWRRLHRVAYISRPQIDLLRAG